MNSNRGDDRPEVLHDFFASKQGDGVVSDVLLVEESFASNPS